MQYKVRNKKKKSRQISNTAKLNKTVKPNTQRNKNKNKMKNKKHKHNETKTPTTKSDSKTHNVMAKSKHNKKNQ